MGLLAVFGGGAGDALGQHLLPWFQAQPLARLLLLVFLLAALAGLLRWGVETARKMIGSGGRPPDAHHGNPGRH